MKYENTSVAFLLGRGLPFQHVVVQLLATSEVAIDKLYKRIQEMDKKIRTVKAEVKKSAKKEEKDLSQLQKMDKKRDKVCDYGKKMMAKKKKK
jgi:hypothetical protein